MSQPNPFKAERVPWFDHFLIASDDASSLLVDTIVSDIEQHETRTRRRTDAATARLSLTIDNIVTNCLRRLQFPVKGNIDVPTSRRKQMPPKRYRSDTQGDTFRVALDTLQELNYIDQKVGKHSLTICQE